jgi:protein phosphatase
VAHGLAETLAQLEPEAPAFKEEVAAFIDALPSHFVLDGGRLVVAHAGLKAEMQGRATGRVRDFALYGDVTGEVDAFGLPVRLDWAAGYRGQAMVVYGHTPVPAPEWVNNTINVDTGCVFGGRLTALRYPEKELVSVPAGRVYFQPARPLEAPPEAPPGTGETAPPAPPAAPRGGSAQRVSAGLLDIGDVLGRQVVETRLHRAVTIREEQSAAALEVISRFAADPRWLIYLPPTMSPTETSREAGLLEHPAEAFAYYRREAVERVVCEEKHMGSRAVLVVCRSEDVARTRFGVTVDEEADGTEGAPEAVGICYTRTGRHFFESRATERALLARVGRAIERAGLWAELETDWLCLDAELMPWSVKAQALLQQQYAAVGAAARAALPAAVSTLTQAAARHAGDANGVGDDGAGGEGGAIVRLLERYQERLGAAGRFVAAYRRYCWEVQSLADLKLAPFQILASEGRVHVQQNHAWHMETLARLAGADPELFLATPYQVVTLGDEMGVRDATAWWEALTERGGEGMVVKPLEGIARGRRGLLQPAIKCRGREYLRLIYGPEYTAPEHLERLRQRGLGAKRSLALREFALGVEGLQRFVEREPLYRVHQCAFGVLALESEPVDPRL